MPAAHKSQAIQSQFTFVIVTVMYVHEVFTDIKPKPQLLIKGSHWFTITAAG